MRRILVITMLVAFVTGANAEERCPNRACESTWTQWFSNTVVFVMVEQYAATKIPQLAQLNTWIATQAVAVAGFASTWLMAKYTQRFGAIGRTTASSMDKID